MATHEKADSFTRGFHEQLSSVVIASSFFLKGSKPVRGSWDCPVQWDSGTCLESPRGGVFCLFSKICSSGSGHSWSFQPSHGFLVLVVLSLTALVKSLGSAPH